MSKPCLTAKFDLDAALEQFSETCRYSGDDNHILRMAHDLLSHAEFMWFKGVKTGHYFELEACSNVFKIFDFIEHYIPERFVHIREAVKGADINRPRIPKDSMFGYRVDCLVGDIRHTQTMHLKFFLAAKADKEKRARITQQLPRLTHSDSQSVLALEDRSECHIVPEQDVATRRLRRQARALFLGNGEVLQVPFPLAHPGQSQNNQLPVIPPTNG